MIDSRRSIYLAVFSMSLLLLFLAGCGANPEAREYLSPSGDYAILQIRQEGAGVVEPNVGSHSFARGTIVDLIARPADGWYFKEWLGEVANPGFVSTTILMDTNKVVTAIFAERETYDPSPYQSWRPNLRPLDLHF